MPELPEVETIKSAICQSIGNCNIKDIIVNNNRLREKIPDDIGGKICGAAILGYRRIAKYIVIDLDNGISLIWHMGMSGKVKITDEVPQHAEKHDHVLIITLMGRYPDLTDEFADLLRNGKAETAQAVCQAWTGTAGLRIFGRIPLSKAEEQKGSYQSRHPRSGGRGGNRQHLCFGNLVQGRNFPSASGRQSHKKRMPENRRKLP